MRCQWAERRGADSAARLLTSWRVWPIVLNDALSAAAPRESAGMKLSVVMTVRNGERYLPEAVASVLNQTLEDFELLIVDDASTDGTSAMLASYARQDQRIRILTNDTNRGRVPERKSGPSERQRGRQSPDTTPTTFLRPTGLRFSGRRWHRVIG